MNDRSYRLTKQRLQRTFERLVGALNLGQVGFTLHYHRERSDPHGDGSRTAAEIAGDWCYGKANIQIYVSSFEDLDDDEIARILIHELVHYWLAPISRYGTSPEYDQLEERICTEIAYAISNAMAVAGAEVADHWKLETKRLERQLKAAQKASA